MELVDTQDSKSCVARRAGSIPATSTKTPQFIGEFFMFYVYAISSLRKNYIYVGMSADVQRRISEHNAGKEKTTRPYLPYRLLYVESCENRIMARKREKYWKSGTGKEQLRILRDSRA